MEAGFWHQRWQENQIGFHQADINEHLKTFWSRLKLKKGAHVFVPLCGKSRDLLWLAEQGYQVTGVELSQQAVNAFFQENDLPVTQRTQETFTVSTSGNIELYCGDLFNLNNALVGEIDAVYDRAALIALPEEMRHQYVKQLLSLLQSPTPILLVTMVYPQEQMDGPPFSVNEKEVSILFNEMSELQNIFEMDLLNKEKRFAEKGVTSLKEIIYKIVV